MRLILKIYPTPARNLALDEAILDAVEDGESDTEVLRVWSASQPYIVIGRSGKVESEVDVLQARSDGVPILRRSSGGGAVVVADGCLFYSLVLSLKKRPELRMLDQTHRFVMQRLVSALKPLEPALESAGTCDLILGTRKVSGNSLRVRRNWLLYHGTLLLDMNLDLISRYLRHPPREPVYRGGRRHEDFLTNLHLNPQDVRNALSKEFAATESEDALPEERIETLQSEKFDCDAWNFQR